MPEKNPPPYEDEGGKDKSIFYRRGIRYKRYVSFDPLGFFLFLKPKILEPLVRDFEGRQNWPRAKG